MGQEQVFFATSSLPLSRNIRQVNEPDRSVVSHLGVADLAVPVVIVHNGSRRLVRAGALATQCALYPSTWPETVIGHFSVEGAQHGRQQEAEGRFRGTQLLLTGRRVGKTVALWVIGSGISLVSFPPYQPSRRHFSRTRSNSPVKAVSIDSSFLDEEVAGELLHGSFAKDHTTLL